MIEYPESKDTNILPSFKRKFRKRTKAFDMPHSLDQKTWLLNSIFLTYSFNYDNIITDKIFVTNNKAKYIPGGGPNENKPGDFCNNVNI